GLQPMRCDRCVEDQLADLLRRPTRGQLVVGFAHAVVLLDFLRFAVLCQRARWHQQREDQAEAQRKGAKWMGETFVLLHEFCSSGCNDLSSTIEMSASSYDCNCRQKVTQKIEKIVGCPRVAPCGSLPSCFRPNQFPVRTP